MKHLIELNYMITRQRGLISSQTTSTEFIEKLNEEVDEFVNCAIHGEPGFEHELADIILVCFNIANHYGIDIEKQLMENLIKNAQR